MVADDQVQAQGIVRYGQGQRQSGTQWIYSRGVDRYLVAAAAWRAKAMMKRGWVVGRRNLGGRYR
jgi:hypothetical protein